MEWLRYQNGTYITNWASSHPSRILPTVRFYPKAISVILHASYKAKHKKYDDIEWCKSSLGIVRALESIGTRIEISGTESFKKIDGPAIFLSNHMSILETFVFPVIIQPFKKVTFIVKEGLVEYPIFKHIMRSRNPVTVSRTNPREDLKAVLDGGAERLSNGVSLIIFPQRTRLTHFEPSEFNSLGIKLGRRTNSPVVPVAIKTDAWGNGKFLKDFGKMDPSKTVRFAFGEPLWIHDRGNEEHDKVVGFIADKFREWEKQDQMSA